MPDVVVVGAGPGGMAAALSAAAAGLEVVLVDENPAPGGQIFRRPANGRAHRAPLPAYASALSPLRDGGAVSGVTSRLGATVWAIDEGNRVHLASADGTEMIAAAAVVLAGGTYEWPPPVPGWTLPGVMTAGGAQALLKGHGVVPGRRVLIAGTGPLILRVAAELAEAGVEVVAVLDVMAAGERWLASLGLLACPEVAGEGLALLWRLRRAGVPLFSGWLPRRISGRQAVEAVEAAPWDGRFRGPARRWQVDTVCLSYGLVPSVELAALRGCALDHDGCLGGWVPRRDPDMQTTVPGVYAVGDGAGVLGARVAVAQGRIAGAAIAERLGGLPESEAARIVAAARRTIRRLRPLGHYLGRAYRPRLELVDPIESDVMVCRCEEISAATITAEIEAGAHSLHEIKTACRAGMGPCQGRLCMPTIARMVARATGRALADVGFSRPRPPVKPLDLDQLAPVHSAAGGTGAGADHDETNPSATREPQPGSGK